MRSIILAVGLVAIAIAASPVWGQQTLRGLEPVDQTVTDMDQLSESLRYMEMGLRPDGEQTSLFRVADSWRDPWMRDARPWQRDRTYYRIGPGFVSRVDRLDYLVIRGQGRDAKLRLNLMPRRDGEFVELIPANTVFELRPLDQLLLEPADQMDMAPPSPYLVDTFIDRRIDYRVAARPVDYRVGQRVSEPNSEHQTATSTPKPAPKSKPRRR